MPKFSVCVFCGSRLGNDTRYQADAKKLGEGIAKAGWRLIYGAGSVGIMGEVAQSAQSIGGETVGVIPTHLQKHEKAKLDLTHLIITENMHERKKVMFMNSDAVVLLPGGAGSLDEIFEVLTWRQLGLHEKPILILNSNGFWDPLLQLIDHVINSGFAEKSLKAMLEFYDTPEEIMARLSNSAD